MDVSVGREEIVHDDEMYLPAVRYLYAMKAVKLGEQGVWVVFHMGVLFLQYLP